MQGSIIFTSPYSDDSDREKFETCKHRSKSEREYSVDTCCSHVNKIGYICTRIPLNGVTPNVCNACELYQKKD